MPRLHWFWRAAIAAAAAYLSCICFAFMYNDARSGLYELLRSLMTNRFATWVQNHDVIPCIVLPTMLTAILVFVLMAHFAKSISDRETRCRKCGYILRGISEPRCPECGERI
jgi:ABC-type molybdate transport system permease subunit